MSSFPQLNIIRSNIGNTITIPNQLDVRETTYFSQNANAGDTNLFAVNAVGFNTQSLLLLNATGSENAEFIESTTHSATDFTTLATTFAHNRGEIIQEVNYNQVIIERGPTIAGPFVQIAGLGMRVTQQNTIYYDTTGTSTDFYRIHWRNSVTTGVSADSDPQSVQTYPVNSAANIIYPVLRAMGVSEDDPKINVTFLLSALDDARIYTHNKLYGIRQAWQAEFEHPIKMLAGTNFVDLPDNIDFNESSRSVLAARLLIGNLLTPYNLREIDKRSWNQMVWSRAGGLSTTNTGIGAVTIDLNSAGDFPQAPNPGTAFVATTDFDQTIMTVQYTGVDLVNNQLTGVTGVTRAFPAGTQIWQNPTIGTPICYTIHENKLWFDQVVPDSLQGANLYLDYYKVIDRVTDLYQEIPEHYRDIYKSYLKYAIKYRKDNSISQNDPDYVKFEQLVAAVFANMWTGQESTIVTS